MADNEKLKEAQEMLQKGQISQDEFNAMVAEIESAQEVVAPPSLDPVAPPPLENATGAPPPLPMMDGAPPPIPGEVSPPPPPPVQEIKETASAEFAEAPPMIEMTTVPVSAEARYEEAIDLFNAGRYDEAAPIFLALANEGLTEAYYALGFCERRRERYASAFDWFQKSAEQQGKMEAQYFVGLAYLEGEGVTKDEAKAVQWFRKSAEQGDPDAQNALADCFYYGKGVPKDISQAIAWYRKSADQGDRRAQYDLGYAYYHGEGVPEDEAKAAELFRKSAEQGHTDSNRFMGIFHRDGIGGVKQDFNKAEKYFNTAIKQGSDRAKQDLEKLKEMRALAAMTHEELNDKGVEYFNAKNYEKAVELYHMAAEKGNQYAQSNLGYCYREGYGVKVNLVKSANFYLKAAEQGHTNSMVDIGWMYENGKGVEQNKRTAFQWYMKAAEQGNRYGLCNVGVFYHYGLGGCKQDFKKAKEYYNKALAAGNERAKEKLEDLKETIKSIPKLNFKLSLFLAAVIAVGIYSFFMFFAKTSFRIFSLGFLLSYGVPFVVTFMMLRRKKIIPILVLIAFSVGGIFLYNSGSFSGTKTRTRAEAAAATVTVTSDALNLRSDASGSSEIVKVLYSGDKLTVTGESNNGWLPVEHEGSRGWVSAQYVSSESAAAAQAQPAQTQTAAAQPNNQTAQQTNQQALDFINATEHRGKNGQDFQYYIRGNTSGTVWGTGPYTDDSNIAHAAIHAGKIRQGETGWVTIRIQPGQSSYSGSTANGVTSSDYGSWAGSYIFP